MPLLVIARELFVHILVTLGFFRNLDCIHF